jgi:hypothetical protein
VKIFNGYTGVGSAMVASAWPLSSVPDDLSWWIDLIVKVVALIVAAISAKKAGEK